MTEPQTIAIIKRDAPAPLDEASGKTAVTARPKIRTITKVITEGQRNPITVSCQNLLRRILPSKENNDFIFK